MNGNHADRTVRLTTAQAIVKFLQAQWTEFDGQRERLFRGVFGLFGHGNVVGLGQALEEYGHDLAFYQAKNEQSAVHQAIGYAKAKDRLSTFACAASIGPGSTNMVTGAATATSNRLPVLLLPADTFARRRQGPVLQQIEDLMGGDITVNDSFRPVSRFFDRVSYPEQLLSALPEACRVLTDQADTGAVTISFHQDTEGEAWDFPARFFESRVWYITRRPPADEQIARAADLIRNSERPFLIAGGGVRYSRAGAAVAEFSERFGVPVGETFAGKASVPSGPYHLGAVGVTGTGGANAIATRADLVICMGTRLQDFTTASNSLFQNPAVRFVGINVAGRDAFKLGGAPIVADAKLSVERLGEALQESGWKASDEYRNQTAAEGRVWADLIDRHLERPPGQIISQGEVLRIVNHQAQAGDVMVAAAGSPPADVHKLWDHSNGTEVHLEFGYSCMGHEVPGAMGYKMARSGDTEVYVIQGEGGWLLSNPEIVSAVQEGIKVTVILVTNDGYQSIRALQEGTTGVQFGTELRYRDGATQRLTGGVLPVDFVLNAESLGCQVFYAPDIAELEDALRDARRSVLPVVIVCPVEPYRMLPGGDAWWDVGIAEESEEAEMRQIAELHLKGRESQRFYYAGAVNTGG
ncbi:MAG: 3D-(3,5/4)-trihydroxycyclohexane-1,2-dione acylhydrolase (decyclizing) [Actinomycetia bacterium]|nr:3D-(3,5/4)-trihydroxycyclohexane-1,2-dione acylhydrolase (decyclizing) [Actinomycetes bacterium]